MWFRHTAFVQLHQLKRQHLCGVKPGRFRHRLDWGGYVLINRP